MVSIVAQQIATLCCLSHVPSIFHPFPPEIIIAPPASSETWAAAFQVGSTQPSWKSFTSPKRNTSCHMRCRNTRSTKLRYWEVVTWRHPTSQDHKVEGEFLTKILIGFCMFWCCQTLVAKPLSHYRRCLNTPRSPRMRWCQRHLCSLWCHGCTLAGYTQILGRCRSRSAGELWNGSATSNLERYGRDGDEGGRVHKKTPTSPTSCLHPHIINYVIQSINQSINK